MIVYPKAKPICSNMLCMCNFQPIIDALYALRKRAQYLPSNHPDLVYSNHYASEQLLQEGGLLDLFLYFVYKIQMKLI